MKNKEVWVPITGTNNLYSISNLGRVKSFIAGNCKIICKNKNQIQLNVNNETLFYTRIELMAKHFKVNDFSIKTLGKQTPRAIYRIVSSVMRYYNLSESTLFGKTRNRHVVTARQMIFKLSRQTTKYSLSSLGKFLNTKDHQLPGYSIRVIDQLIDVDKRINSDYLHLLSIINTTESNSLCEAIKELIPM